MTGYLDGRWPFQLRIPRLLSLLLPVQGQIREEERWAGPPGSGPRSRRGRSEQQPRRQTGTASASPPDAPNYPVVTPTYPVVTPGLGTPEPDHYASIPPGARAGAQRQKELPSPQRPGQAICPLPSPAADRAGRAIHVRSPSRPREPGGPRRAVTWPSAPGSLGNPGPGAQGPDPGSRKQRKDGERTRL